MKNITKFITMLVAIITASTMLHAEVGCMDNSYHLTQRYDAKNYHYVQCNCSCTQYPNFSDRGQCLQCQHYHKPKNWMVVSDGKVVMRAQQTKPVHSMEQVAVLPQTRAIINTMVANYKRQK